MLREMSSVWPSLADPRERPQQRLSLEQWWALPPDEPGELVRGFLEEEEMPDAVHELAVSWLIARLRSWVGANGFVFSSELKLSLSDALGRKPDVSVYFEGTAPPPRRGPVRQPPDLIVEVVSPSPRDERRDRVDKMTEYADFRVGSYWLVDPALGTVEIFQLQNDGRYVRVAAAAEGTLQGVPGHPGLSIDVDALWAELARLEEPPE